jgi:hypothetical protein
MEEESCWRECRLWLGSLGRDASFIARKELALGIRDMGLAGDLRLQFLTRATLN